MLTHEQARKMIEEAAVRLAEHFEAVEIHVSWMDQGTTKCQHSGVGNWYARIQMAREFVEADHAEEQAVAIARNLEPPDDSTSWKQS